VARSIGATALVLLGLEGALALAGIGEQEYLQPDPLLGYTGMANRDLTWRQEGFGRIHFNSFGMPDIDHPLAKPPGTVRIAVLGDSFVEALQVNRENNFCGVLERNLNDAKLGKKFEVLNFGASAYNLGQMYLRQKQQASQFQPDIVIVAYRHDGVFSLVPDPKSGGMLSARPAFYLQNGKLEMTNALQTQWQHSPDGKRFRLTSWLREHSHIYGVIGTLLQDLQTQLPHAFKFNANAASDADVEAPHAAKASDSEKAKATAYYWPLADALISAMKSDCDRIGSKLIVLRLPRSEMSRNDFESALLKETAQRCHIPVIETDSDYEDAPSRHLLFYSNHFSPAGHKLMADKLQGYILSTIGIPSKVSP
jgi:hypothetical protein